MNHDHRVERAAMLALLGLAFVACVYIASAAYLGINGSHAWRQALTYGHILGLAGDKGFAPFDLFTLRLDGQGEGMAVQRVYDMPIYQYLIAKTALLSGGDPLVIARYFNVVFWLLAAGAGYRLSRALGGRRGGSVRGDMAGESLAAGVVFVYLLATSPLILHYYSAPMPDTLALALALLGTALLLQAMGTQSPPGPGNSGGGGQLLIGGPCLLPCLSCLSRPSSSRQWSSRSSSSRWSMSP